MVTYSKNSADKYKELTALFCAGQSGDITSYNQFLQQISPILYRIVAKKMPLSDIEDVLQEILISLHRARHTYDGGRPLMPWVFAIAQFRINDHLRKLYAQPQDTVDIDAMAEILGSDVTKSYEDNESVEELLKDTPDREKKILTMMYVEGRTAKETAQRMEMNESAVKVSAHRAIKKIRESFGI